MERTPVSAADWTSIEIPQDIRLVVADMDGTLLDSAKRLPAELPEVIAKLKEKGVRTPVRYLACHVRR